MEAQLFFDFASARAYLLAAQIQPWAARFAVTLRPLPIDGAALAALSGEPTIRHADAGARYERADTLRWADRLRLPLRFSPDPPKSGPALRACAQLLVAHPDAVWPFISAVFDRAWARAEPIDEPNLRPLLASLLGPDTADGVLRAAASADAFADLEDHTRRALRLGLFDVPTLRIADALFVGHDRLPFAAAAILEARLAASDPATLHRHLASLLLDLDDDRRAHFLSAITPPALPAAHSPASSDAPDDALHLQSAMETLAHVLSGQRASAAAALHAPPQPPSLPLALALWWCPQDQPIGALQARLSAQSPLPAHSAHDLASLPWLTLGWGGRALVPVESGGAGVGVWAAPVRLLMSAKTPQGRARTLLCDPLSAPSLASHGPSEGGTLRPVTLDGGWRAYVFDGASAEDPALHRAAARQGAHLIALAGLDDHDPRPIATARATGCWVAAFGPHRLRLCDAQGQWAAFDALGEGGGDRDTWWAPLTWPPSLSARAVGRPLHTWQPPDARAVLLNEQPVALGPPGSAAELVMACRGHSLRLEIAAMRSTISPGRPFELIRLDAGPLAIIPVFADQLRAADLLAERTLRALTRANGDCALLIVSYWPDTDADAAADASLDMAAAAVEHRAPVAVIVGERPVALWHPEQDEPRAYRIEPEGDTFHFDMALQPPLKARHRLALSRVSHHPQRYLDMLAASSP